MNDLNTDIKKSNEKFEDLLNKKYINKIEKNEKYKDLFILLNKKEEDNKKKNNNSNIIFNSNLQKSFKNNKYNKLKYKINFFLKSQRAASISISILIIIIQRNSFFFISSISNSTTLSISFN